MNARVNKLAQLANKSAIIRILKAEGYTLAKNDKRYGNLNVQTIFRATESASEWYEDAAHRKDYKCSMYENVPGIEPGTRFVVLSINDIDHKRQLTLPREMIFFVKSN